MDNDENNSCLVFCSIKNGDNLLDMNFIDVWKKYVESKEPDVSCTQVVHFEMLIGDLHKSFESGIFLESINRLLNEEHNNGANYVFVNSIVGQPVAGFFLLSIISS